ncbi:MAG: PAS domain S-box protein, partial [Bacteroidales bacterium]|nr:PAS domain S-box protein [Bacteroidales bacterium]
MYENNEVIDDTTVQIFKQIHGQIHDKLQKGLTFAKETKYLGTHYLLAFHSIENIEGEHVAYVISYEEDETLHIYFNRFIQMLMIASMVVFIIFFLFFLTITKNSALKLVHKDLLHSEKRFKQLSNLTFEGIVIHDKGLILEVNLSMVTMFGYEAEEFIGQSINILLASDEDREIIKKNLIKNYAFPYEVNGMKKDGNIFPLEIEAKDLTDKDNNPIRVAAVRDISQKKKIQMDLKRSDARFRALFDKNSEPIMLSPLNDFFTHNIIDVNPAACKYLGYSREELLAIAPKDISRPVDNLDSFIDPKKIYEKLKADGNMLIFSNHITKSGNSIPVEVNLQLIDIDNEPIIFAIVRNISQRKQAEKALRDSEEQLRQSQKLEGIGQLAGGIAHDFNNILAAQYGLTDIALMNTEEGSKAHNALLQIKASNERAANLVRHILTFSRKQVFTPINLNINKTIENLNKMVQRLIGEDMEINIKLSPEKLFVNADPSQIEQIMINLFVNARDALKVQNDKTLDKQITITTEAVEISVPFITSTSAIEKGNYILISVKDTGIGMGKETLNQIFEPFYTTKEVGEGTGLGLSTVYGIVKQNNAYINAYSELGKGTTFKIYWPSTKEENQAQIIESSDKKNYEGDETILF